MPPPLSAPQAPHRHPPLLLRSAGWRLGVAAALGALLLLLWRWALAGASH